MEERKNVLNERSTERIMRRRVKESKRWKSREKETGGNKGSPICFIRFNNLFGEARRAYRRCEPSRETEEPQREPQRESQKEPRGTAF